MSLERPPMFSLASRYPEGPILRTIEDLDVPNLASEEMRHVSSARVVLADYELIQHDFPHLRPASLVSRHRRLIPLTDAERQQEFRGIIDDWLLASAAYMSDTQCRQNDFNSEIPVDQGATGYRPPTYGRALVVPVQATKDPRQPDVEAPYSTMPGLLDIKGAGAGPGKKQTSEFNGLEYLACALNEYVIKRAVDAIFEREVPTMWTVPVYAVLDLGFEVREGHLGSGPAGMHVRRAHRRVLHSGHTGPTYANVSMDVEMALRKYGLTATGSFGRVVIEETDGKLTTTIFRQAQTPTTPAEVGLCLRILKKGQRVVIDRTDVQLARGAEWPPATGQMYDFGNVHACASFSRPVGYLFSMSEKTTIWPDDGRYVRPDPVLRLPSETWVRSVLMKRCVNLAKQFRENAIGREDLWRGLELPLQQMVDRWRKNEGSRASAGLR
jgi:hypothetical protein